MFALNCSGLLDETSKWCEAIKLEDDDVIPSSVVCSYHEKSHIAVASETVLTVAMSSIGKKFVNCFDLEIDHSIEVICWGVDASCLIAGDSCGSLHFITPMGELLFSHRILLSELLHCQQIFNIYTNGPRLKTSSSNHFIHST